MPVPDYSINTVAIRAAIDCVLGRLNPQVPSAVVPVGRIVKDVLTDEAPSDSRSVSMPESDWRLIGWALKAARNAPQVPTMAGDEREMLR